MVQILISINAWQKVCARPGTFEYHLWFDLAESFLRRKALRREEACDTFTSRLQGVCAVTAKMLQRFNRP